MDTRIGQLEFTHDFANGYPTAESVEKLYDELDFQRACQAYLWSIPLVAFVQWQQIHRDIFGAENGQMVLYDSYEDKSGILTANTTTPYVIGLTDLLQDGPFVIEIPPGGLVRGAAHDMWQIQITQMLEEGSYLFVGPDQGVPAGAEEQGFMVKRTSMNNFLVGIRLMPEDRDEAMALLGQIKTYPYGNPSDRSYATTGGAEYWTNQPRDMSYWRQLAESINSEPVREIDRYMYAMLLPLGIEKGKDFDPDERQGRILMDALVVGEAMAKANDFAKRLDKARYVGGSHWEYATVANWDQRAEYHQELDEAAAWFYEAVSNDQAMHGQETGWGQVYMTAYQDSDGEWLVGAQDFVLHLPPDVPAEAFWSITLYDVSTRCIIDNDERKADLSSRQELQVNEDGSVDLYFGPTAPDGKQSNWVQTMPEKAWFPYFRFYSPTEAFLDKSWILPDIEKSAR